MPITQDPKRVEEANARIERWKQIDSGTLSTLQCAQLWVDAGGSEEDAPMAAVITRPESGGRVAVVNSIGATGLWQIHPGGEQYKNAWNNAKAAVSKRKGAGKWGPNPWAVCRDGACSNLQSQADALAKKIARRGGLNLPPSSVTGSGGGLLPDIGIPNPLSGLDAIASAIRNIGEALLGILKIYLEVLRKIADPQTYIDALKIFGGIILVYMGLKRLFEVS